MLALRLRPWTHWAACLALALSLSAPTTIRAEEDRFTADLAACQSAVKKRSWKSAGEAYERLFATYEGDRRLVAARESVERDMQQIRFNLRRRPPTGQELFGSSVKKFTANNGRIDLVFEQGIADPLWSASGSGSSLRLLPLRWQDDLIVAVPATGSKTMFRKSKKKDHDDHSDERVQMRAMLCFNLEKGGGYLAITPYALGPWEDWRYDRKSPAQPFP